MRSPDYSGRAAVFCSGDNCLGRAAASGTGQLRRTCPATDLRQRRLGQRASSATRRSDPFCNGLMASEPVERVGRRQPAQGSPARRPPRQLWPPNLPGAATARRRSSDSSRSSGEFGTETAAASYQRQTTVGGSRAMNSHSLIRSPLGAALRSTRRGHRRNGGYSSGRTRRSLLSSLYRVWDPVEAIRGAGFFLILGSAVWLEWTVFKWLLAA